MIATLLVYVAVTCGLYYLGYWAKITEPLWSRYSPRLDAFMHCPACSGFWYGVIVGALGAWRGFVFLGVPGYLQIPIVGFASLLWTPAIMHWWLDRISSFPRGDSTNGPSSEE